MKYLNKTFNVYVEKINTDVLDKLSKCCDEKMVKQGGSWRCPKCGKYDTN